MQLKYRGIQYESTLYTIETEETGLSATFRGRSYSIRRLSNSVSHPLKHLVYRGIPYTQ